MRILLDTCTFLWLVTNDTAHLTETATLPFVKGAGDFFIRDFHIKSLNR
ncbi:hypothetical protein QUF80_14165 [Desulfococcaceae bacterium HSG8]|nr:hypothetical protein [Desulfococcaceae bacterium HSG8]